MFRRIAGSTAVSGAVSLTMLAVARTQQEGNQRTIAETESVKGKHSCPSTKKFDPNCGQFKIFSGSAHPELARNVARNLGTALSPAAIGRFNDGEVAIKVETSVRGADVYVVQPTAPPVSDNLVELLLMISALRNASSRHVTAVVPYFGYMRSDGSELPSRRVGKKNQALYDDEIAIDMIDTHRTSFVAMADIARMLEVVGCSRVITFDLHASGQSAAEGFFADTRVENLRSAPLVSAELVAKLGLQPSTELVVVAPHSSCFSKAKKFQAHLRDALKSENVGLALVVRRPPTTEAGETVVDLVGDVKGKSVLIVEDVVDTGRSLARAARAAREAGAEHVFAFASHAVLSGDAPDRLQKCEALEKVVVLNTVPVSQENRMQCPKLEFIDVAPVMAKLLAELHMKEEPSL